MSQKSSVMQLPQFVPKALTSDRQDIQSGSDAEEGIWLGSDRAPDFLIRWGQIDCELSELGDGEIGPVEKSD